MFAAVDRQILFSHKLAERTLRLSRLIHVFLHDPHGALLLCVFSDQAFLPGRRDLFHELRGVLPGQASVTQFRKYLEFKGIARCFHLVQVRRQLPVYAPLDPVPRRIGTPYRAPRG